MMQRTMRFTLAAAVVLVAGAAPVAGGQLATVGVLSPPSAVPSRAEQLKTAAEQLYSQPRQWRRAVRLLEQSAQLRAADDPQAYSCWMYAARLRASFGDYSGARHNLEKAAAHALARGALIDAADAYIDAAHVAVEENNPHHAYELLQRARLLADSPLLDAAQAERITARMRG